MVNYKNGKIYIIRSNNTEKVYIGSTAEKYLSSRYQKHLCLYKRYLKTQKGYTTSFDVFDSGDTYIQLLESIECNNKYELKNKEQYWINEYHLCCVNKVNPSCNKTKKERIRYNYQKNKIKRVIDNTEYYKNNKEHIQNYKKEWALKNKDKIRERKTKIYNCDCGKTLTIQCKKSHERTKYHRMNVHNILNHL